MKETDDTMIYIHTRKCTMYLLFTNEKYLSFRITLFIEHLENWVKPVVPVDKHSVHPKVVHFN